MRATVTIYSQHTFQFVTLTLSSSLFTRRVLRNVTIAMVTMGTIDSDCSQKYSVQAIIMLYIYISCIFPQCHVACIYTNRTVASEIQTADCPVCAVTISMVRIPCPNSPLPSSCACIEIVHNMLSCRFCGFCKAFTQCHGKEG